MKEKEMEATIYEPEKEEKETPTALMQIEQQRAIQEVQAALVIARRFPRDHNQAYQKIITACKRKSLAEQSMYAYPRRGANITGPSIRLAEMLAQNWGNIWAGIRELSQDQGYSEVEAYAWDLETNTRISKQFQMSHRRKAGDIYREIEDPRDIYEHVANMGARRLRACILQLIPGDIVESAVKECEKTLASEGHGGEPIEDRIRKMLLAFIELGITQEMVEKRLGHKMKATIEAEIVGLRKIYQSIKDGMAKREDFFAIEIISSKDKEEDKTRKPRSDKGATRKPQPEFQPQTPVEILADAKYNDSIRPDLRLAMDKRGWSVERRRDWLISVEMHYPDKMTDAQVADCLAKMEASEAYDPTSEKDVPL